MNWNKPPDRIANMWRTTKEMAENEPLCAQGLGHPGYWFADLLSKVFHKLITSDRPHFRPNYNKTTSQKVEKMCLKQCTNDL